MSDPTPPSVPPDAGPPPAATFGEPVFGAGEPASARRRAGRIAGVALAVAFVLVAGSVAVALFALRGSPDSLGRMVPAGSDFYLSVNLDPGLGQKANLSRLASKFPALQGTAGIRKNVYQAIDDMLRQVQPGMSFERDVQPWLGIPGCSRRADRFPRERRHGSSDLLEGRSGGRRCPGTRRHADRRTLDDQRARWGHGARRARIRGGGLRDRRPRGRDCFVRSHRAFGDRRRPGHVAPADRFGRVHEDRRLPARGPPRPGVRELPAPGQGADGIGDRSRACSAPSPEARASTHTRASA